MSGRALIMVEDESQFRFLQNTTNTTAGKKVFGVLDAESYTFLQSMSKNVSLAEAEMQQINKTMKGGSGHSLAGVNGSTAAFVMFMVILLLLITSYLAYKVYKDKKYFSREWEK